MPYGMSTERFAEFIRGNMDRNYIEAKIVKRVFNALADSPTPVMGVYDEDTGEIEPATTLAELNNIVFNLDDAEIHVKGGGWVRIVLGNDWDALVDFSLNLEEALKPVNDWIDKHN